MYNSQWTGFELTTLVVIGHERDGPCSYQLPKEKSSRLPNLPVNIQKFACYDIFLLLVQKQFGCTSWNAELDHRLLSYTCIFIQNKIRISHLKYCKYKFILILSMNKFKINKTVISRRYHRGNQNPHIEEDQRTQWPKEKVQKDKQQSTNRILNNVLHDAMQYLGRSLLNGSLRVIKLQPRFKVYNIYYLPVIFHIFRIISIAYSM